MRPAIPRSRPDVAGAKGGRKPAPPRTPVEGPNTLRSQAVVRAVELLAEGEIDGLVDGLKSIYLDDTPVQASDGTFNFSGIHFELRRGGPTQDALTAGDASYTERVVNLRVRHGTPVVRTVTNASVGAVRVTIRFPRLVRSDPDTGDTGAVSVSLTIETKDATGPWTTAVAPTINEKASAPSELTWRVPLAGTAPWSVRVTRVTADSSSDRLHNETWWARLTEVVEIRQSYPHSAMMGITGYAQGLDGALPARAYEVRGLVVSVPANYTPATRAYAGVWDGTFKRAWTDNPAWVVYDLLSNARYGLGAYVDASLLSGLKWRLYTIARFCDALVPDGAGGTEPRYRFAGVIESARQARQVIDNVLSLADGALYYDGAELAALQGSPGTTAALIGPANVIDGAFEYGDLGERDRASAVAVTFSDPADGYRRAIELVVDDSLVRRYGYRQRDVVAMFCARRSQARRFGRRVLVEQEHESDVVRFRVGIELSGLRPGDIIAQTDDVDVAQRLLMRVEGYDAATRDVAVDSTETIDRTLVWHLSMVLPDGSVSRTVGRRDRRRPGEARRRAARDTGAGPVDGGGARHADAPAAAVAHRVGRRGRCTGVPGRGPRLPRGQVHAHRVRSGAQRLADRSEERQHRAAGAGRRRDHGRALPGRRHTAHAIAGGRDAGRRRQDRRQRGPGADAARCGLPPPRRPGHRARVAGDPHRGRGHVPRSSALTRA